MHLLLILLGTGAAAWVLKETDYIVPVTAALVLLLLTMAVSPEATVLLVAGIIALIAVAVLCLFLPQILGFIMGAILLIVVLAAAGKAHAEPYLEVKQGIGIMQKMDADTCNEVEGDEIENIYSEKHGWKMIPGGKIKGGWYDSVQKGNKVITFTCQNGYFIRSEGPYKPLVDGQVEYMK